MILEANSLVINFMMIRIKDNNKTFKLKIFYTCLNPSIELILLRKVFKRFIFDLILVISFGVIEENLSLISRICSCFFRFCFSSLCLLWLQLFFFALISLLQGVLRLFYYEMFFINTYHKCFTQINVNMVFVNQFNNASEFIRTELKYLGHVI